MEKSKVWPKMTAEQELDRLWRDSHSQASPVGWLELNARERRRANHYRFATVILSILLILFGLTMRAFNRELMASADEMHQANALLRSQQISIQRQRDVISHCTGLHLDDENIKSQLLEGARIGATLSR